MGSHSYTPAAVVHAVGWLVGDGVDLPAHRSDVEAAAGESEALGSIRIVVLIGHRSFERAACASDLLPHRQEPLFDLDQSLNGFSMGLIG